MKKSLVLACLVFLSTAGMAQSSATQTDWSGGGGVPGPGTAWGNTFDSATGIDWHNVPGELKLGGALITPVVQLLNGDLYAKCIKVCDIDCDGDNDVLSCGAQYVRWWRNDGNGTAWTMINITTSRPGSQYVDAGDIDGNGTCDVILGQSAGSTYEGLYWFENTDGTGTNWVEHSIVTAFAVNRLCASDMNDDGKLDIAFTENGSDPVYWYENINGLGTSWLLHSFSDRSAFQRDLEAVDLDGDGDMDLLDANDSCFVWYENTDGTGTVMVPHEIDVSISNKSVTSLDVDGDGDLDVLAGGNSSTVWYENLDGSCTNWVLHPVLGYYSVSLKGLDIDGDGDGDFLSARTDLTLMVNEDGLGTSWTPVTVNTSTYTSACQSGDLDGDGLDEALSCRYNDAEVIWAKIVEPQSSGELVSSILDCGTEPLWGLMDWSESCPSGSGITMEVRGGYTPETMGSWLTVDSPGDPIPSYLDHHPFLQYRVNFDLGTASETPVLQDITVDWTTTGVGGQMESMPQWYMIPRENPTQCGVLFMDLMAAQAGPVTVRVHDLSGRTVAEKTIQAAQGLQTVSFTGLPAGVFLCTAQAQGYTGAVRVVVLD